MLYVKINTEGHWEEDTFSNETCLLKLQDAVGGLIEAIDIPFLHVTMWINENGKFECEDPHPFATALYRSAYQHEDVVMGNVAFTSMKTDIEGYTLGLTQKEKDILFAYHQAVPYNKLNMNKDSWGIPQEPQIIVYPLD